MILDCEMNVKRIYCIIVEKKIKLCDILSVFDGILVRLSLGEM